MGNNAFSETNDGFLMTGMLRLVIVTLAHVIVLSTTRKALP